ncbi:hypothetical protein CPB83DRAFT_579833 [Crepidotus variabilis]|uniref:Nephrocystin 3-like N-terminal domain-containing protein n=1 Tax=Crepidotus variabilis TaxID=179855 RepID=A0A9P6EPF0_9AGAR|nr:hypothetical protein CPB83DRAFT_579833 [Crepidotus variabilis]
MLLSEFASQGAMHDSSARQPFPKCHPQTRLNVVDFFFHWITTPTTSKSVYWLYAPFGHGKSAVMQTLIDRLMTENFQHLVAGAFFFARGKPECNKVIYLLPTIAYQIAINIPGMREHITKAIQTDPKLLSRSMDVQLRSLIKDPLFRCVDGAHFKYPPTVFIDGLDECTSIEEQLSVLDLIIVVLQEFHIPLRFLVASRPEAHIRDRFAQPHFVDILEQIRLPDDQGEMIVCLKSKFDDICDRRARLMKVSNIQKPWPSEKEIKQLVVRSCGQYIFLDTITRFVDTERRDPAAQLKTVLYCLADSSLFSNMDTLYSLILEEAPHPHILKVVIDDLLYRRTHSVFSIPAIAEIWQFSKTDIQIVLDSLSAVVKEWEGRDLTFLSYVVSRVFGKRSSIWQILLY